MSVLPAIVVAGLGRSGTSLTMQMLDKAGVPTVGTFPAYEDYERKARAGEAIKWLDPHRLEQPFDGEAVVIWCTRDRRQQALSQRKFVSMMTGHGGSSDLTAWDRALLRDKNAAWQALSGWPMAVLRFDKLVTDPERTTSLLCRFLRRHGHKLDASVMASCVIPRGPECQPGLDIELRLVEAAA